MSYATLAARRRLCGLAATAILVLVLALVADGMIAGGRADPNEFRLLPGQSVSLSERMPAGAQQVSDLSLSPSSPGIATRMVETFSGFWLGGTLWRAEAQLAPDLAPGDYTLVLRHQHNGTEAAPRQAFRVRVFRDAVAMQAAEHSLLKRATGVSAYLLAVCLLPLVAAPAAASYALSRRIAATLAAERTAEIYRAMASPEGQRIFFSLTPGHGLAPGEAVELLHEKTEAVLGAALVTSVRGGDIEAVLQNGAQVRPGALARPARPAPSVA